MRTHIVILDILACIAFKTYRFFKINGTLSNTGLRKEYLIDANGNIRRTHFGEGEYDQTEKAIQVLLQEAGKKVCGKLDIMQDQTPQNQISPETYLGSKRMQYYYPTGSIGNGTQNFTLSDNVPQNSFSYGELGILPMKPQS